MGGGGGIADTSSLNKVFKPLIASSLALALSVSVGSANNRNNNQISSDTTISSGVQTGNIIMDSSQNSFLVTFEKGTSLHADITRNGNIYNPSAGNVTVNFLGGSTMEGNIKTGVQDGNDYSANIVTFSGVTNAETNVLTGNIYSGGHRSDDPSQYGNHVTFTNGSMKGDILTKKSSWQGGYNKVTFSQSGAVLTGNIIANQGTNEVYFSENGRITGKVYSAMGNNTVAFTGNATITGGVQTSSDGYSSVNTVTINGTGDSIIGEVVANGNYYTNSKNIITAQKMTSANSLTVASLAAYNGNGKGVTSGNINEINIGSGKLIVNSGGLVASDGGSNIIIAGAIQLNGNGGLSTSGGYSSYNTVTINGTENSIIGEVVANGNYNTNSKNTITAQQMASTSSLTVTSLAAYSGKVTGNIATSGNINEINIGSGKLIVKSGDIYAVDGGNNIITAGNLELSDLGNIKIGFAGYTSYNTITLSGADTTATVGSISVDGNNNTTSTNKIDVANNFVVSKSISTKGGSRSNNAKGNENIITVNGVLGVNVSRLPQQPTLPFDISIIDGDANNIAISADRGTNTIRANKNALILGQIIATNSGVNNLYIHDTNGATSNVANPNYIGSIQSNGGTNNIIFDGGFWAPNGVTGENGGTASHPTYGIAQSGILTTSNGGSTNIIFRQGKNNPLGTDVAQFRINHSGSGQTNIVMQSNTTAVHVNTEMFLNYGSSGEINTIFAAANTDTSRTTESFSHAADASQDTFFGVKYTNGVKLTLKDRDVGIGNDIASLVNTYGSTYRDENGVLARIVSKRDATNSTDTITVDGLIVGTIKALDETNGARNYNVTLDAGSVFAGSITLNSDAKIQLTMNYDKRKNMGSKFIVTDNVTKIKTLTIDDGTIDTTQFQRETLEQRNTVINLATGGASSVNTKSRKNSGFRLLEIGESSKNANTGLLGSGAALFVNYIDANVVQGSNGATLGGKHSTDVDGYGKAYADRIIVHNAGNNSRGSTAQFYMQLAVDNDTKLSSIKYTDGGTETDGNIAVATIAKTTTASSGGATEAEIRNMGVINIKEADVMQGFDQISGTLKAVETKADGTIDGVANNNTYVTYFVNHMETKGATQATQGVSASALATNYDLYIANFNSLNKRMGELRNNDNSQGVWARVFNGSQTNDFGLGTTTNYTTIQGGYDYALGFEGANNYIGLAIAYSMSTSKTNSDNFNAISGNIEGIQDIKSNLVEVAIYNSYVQDEGWYNDSIFKFSYVMSDFTMILGSDKQSTSNMAYTLSDEFGYRFKLGAAKEWYIDPQAELSFGYFDQTDFIQKLGGASLNSKADTLMTLRTRLGSSFGYDFKQFTEGKGVDASVYVGAFYEYDYITGGNITLNTNLGGTNTLDSSLTSDGRVVMNVGTNVTVKENTRIYFDFETSFAGKIRTDYQVNAGIRYSFGENIGYTPVDPNKKSITPLKVSDQKVEESKESTNSETKSENTAETNANSTENKTEEKAQ